jgi:hypothetical protein
MNARPGSFPSTASFPPPSRAAGQFGSTMPKPTRDALFVQLGSGEYPHVIHAFLTHLGDSGRVLSSETVAKVRAWLNGYQDHEKRAHLLELVNRCMPQDER